VLAHAHSSTADLLPASGEWVRLREPTGEDELLVLDSMGSAPATTLALAIRLAADEAGPDNWLALPAVDLSSVALMIRRVWLGDTIRAEALCTAAGCDEPIDVTFSISSYLAHHRPRPWRGAYECEPGWFGLKGSDVRFRIPTIGDLLDALERPSPVSAMRERCMRPSGPSATLARRVDRALDALAPRLDGELGGICPECGRTVALQFEPMSYVLEEIRDASVGLLSQVHQIALAYHWPEEKILALDRPRRHAYVALIREEPALV
jgi:hypothetical protein